MSISMDSSNIYESPNLIKMGEVTYILVPADKEKLNFLGVSTLEPSAKQIEREALSASIPYLIDPSFYLTDVDKLAEIGLRSGGLKGVSYDGSMLMINMSAFSSSIENKYYEAVNAMLDKWSESIKETEQRVQEELKSPGYLNWLDEKSLDYFETKDIARISSWDMRTSVTSSEVYKDWVQSLPPLDREKEMSIETRFRILKGLEVGVNDYKEYVQEKSPEALPFVMASLAIGMTFMGEYIGLVAGVAKASFQAGVHVILQAVTEMAAPILEQNLAALGYFGALFAVGVLYQTSDQIALNVGKLSQGEVNKKFAKEFAANIIKLIETPDFNLFLNANLTLNVKDGPQLKNSEKKELIHAMKLILLSVSLALLYKAETGKITAEEFVAMLKGEIVFEKDPNKELLAQTILMHTQQLGTLRQPIIEAIISYLDKDPDFEEMFDVYKVFEGIRQTEALTEDVRIRQRG